MPACNGGRHHRTQAEADACTKHRTGKAFSFLSTCSQYLKRQALTAHHHTPATIVTQAVVPVPTVAPAATAPPLPAAGPSQIVDPQLPRHYQPNLETESQGNTPDDFVPVLQSAPSENAPSQATTSASYLTLSSSSSLGPVVKVRNWLRDIQFQLQPLRHHHHTRQPSGEDLALVEKLQGVNDGIPPMEQQLARDRARSLQRSFQDAQAAEEVPERRDSVVRRVVRWAAGLAVVGFLPLLWFVRYVVFEAETRYGQKRFAEMYC